MIKNTLIIVAIATCTSTYALQPPVEEHPTKEEIETYGAKCKEFRLASLVRARLDLEVVQEAIKAKVIPELVGDQWSNAGPVVSSRSSQRNALEKQVDGYRKRIRDLENPLVPICAPLSLHVPQSVGSMDWEFELSNVLSTDSGWLNGSEARLINYPLGTLVNGSRIHLVGMFYLNRDRSMYKVDLSKYTDYFTRKDEAMNWGLRNGGQVTRAIYVNCVRERVSFVQLDGKAIRVDVADLNDEFQNRVLRHVEKEVQMQQMDRTKRVRPELAQILKLDDPERQLNYVRNNMKAKPN